MNISTQLIILILLAGWATTLVISVFILALTKGVTFPTLKAKWKRVPLILLYTKAKTAKLITGTYAGGTLDTKYGPFFLNPDALMPFEGTSIGIAYEDVAHTPTPEFIEAANQLKKAGVKDYTTAMKLRPKLLAALQKEQGKPKTKQDASKIKALSNNLKNIVLIKDYFKFALNPTHVNEKVSNALQIRLGQQRTNTFIWGMIIIGVLMAGAIAFYIVTQATGSTCNYGPYKDALAMCKAGTQRVIANQSIV